MKAGWPMSTRKVYHVVPHSDGRWAVEGESPQRASGLQPSQAAAIEHATQLAKSQTLGQVKIHGKNIEIREEHTYGKDPFPPKG